MPSETSQTALLVIDVQVGLVTGSHAVEQANRLFAHLNDLLVRARAAGATVIFVQDIDVGGADSSDFQIHPAIVPHEHELVIHKRAADAFYDTPLHTALAAKGIQHLVVSGCKTEYCIDTTCRFATNLGYDVTLAKDAHATTGNGVLTAAQIVAHHNRLLDGFGVDGHYVVVRDSNEVEFPMTWSGHPV